MDEPTTTLDKRLTSVEKDVAVLNTDMAAQRSIYATREDVARLEGRVMVIQSNYATKEDLAALDRKLSGEMHAMDSRLSGRIGAVEVQLAKLETSMMRWSIATIISLSAVIVAVTKIWH